MSATAAFRDALKFKDLPATYRELTSLYAPRPIRSQSECERATAIVDAMAGHALNRDQEDYLDLISTLLSNYEEQHDPVRAAKLSPVEALRFLLEEAGMNASDLGRLLGSRDLGSKILRGQRGLSIHHIMTLSRHFAVSPELFLPVAADRRRRDSRKMNGAWRRTTRSRIR